MAATNVYRGSDGTISVAVGEGTEGELAGAVAEEYALTPVGRATGVTIKVENELRPFHELGQRFATELRPGNLNVYGSIDRAYINGALLKLMLGSEAATSRPATSFASPAFNLSVRVENPALPDNASTVTVMGAKIEEWNFALPEDEFVMEQVTFRALWVKVEDEAAA